MSTKNSFNRTNVDYDHHSARSGMTKRKFTKDFKRYKADKYADANFWKRARNIRFHKQSREDYYAGGEDFEDTQTTSDPLPLPPLAGEHPRRREYDVPIVCPALYTRPRFCDLSAPPTPFEIANTIDVVNDVLMYRQISSHRFNGDAVFFRELGLWKCTFDDSGPHQHSGSFEIRMMSDNVGVDRRLMLVLTRTSGDNLDGDTGVDHNQDGYVEALGPNETFFRYIANKFDR